MGWWDGGVVGDHSVQARRPQPWGIWVGNFPIGAGEAGTWLKASTCGFDSPSFCPYWASFWGQTPFNLA